MNFWSVLIGYLIGYLIGDILLLVGMYIIDKRKRDKTNGKNS